VPSAKLQTETDWLVPGNITKALQDAFHKKKIDQTDIAIGPLLRTIIANARRAGIETHSYGDALARCLSTSIDQIIRTLLDDQLNTQGLTHSPICIIAVGGYGRSDLAPYSDIDLLFLHAPQNDEIARPFLDALLYPLWDSGLKIGYGVHTPNGAVNFCKEDMTGRTAYLESRYLTGDHKLYDEFTKAYDKLRRSTIHEFVKAKLDEAEERHELSEQSRFLVEPDIKEGKGGLRDIHTIGWLYHYVYGSSIDGSAAQKPVLEKDEIKAFMRARQYLQTIRAQLHMARGTDDNKLSFDIQPEIAEKLSYAARRNMSPAERMMKHYFVTATDVGRLTRIFCARLEAENTKRLPQLPKILPSKILSDGLSSKPNIKIRNGRLDFDKPARANQKPLDWFRLIHVFSRQTKFDIHPAALSIIAKNLKYINKQTRNDREIASLFRNILIEAKNPIKTMRLMGETGLLGKYIPTYGKITGRIIYGLYRRFSLDEQTIQALSMLCLIHRGSVENEHPVITGIIQNSKDPYPYFLAVLFHELIWTIRDRDVEKGQALISRITTRLGLEKKDAVNTSWVAANRTLMIDTIERRKLADTRTIEHFCNQVKTPERLDLLLLVTTCHLKVVGLNVWDDRQRRQLQTLYESALAWFSGKQKELTAYQQDRAKKAHILIEEQLPNWSQAEKNWLIERVTPLALHTVEPTLWARFAPLMRNADKENLPGAVSVSLRNDGTVEAIIYGPDRDGLLTDLAGAVSMLGISFRSVEAMTTTDRKIIDVFILQSVDGHPLTDPTLVSRIHKSLLQTINSRPKKLPKPSRRLGDRRDIFHVTPSVRLDHEASDDCLVVEAIGLDRPGLLYQLTQALTDIGVTIRSAHVSTYGERAVDSFYLQDAPGYKITNKRRLQSIERRLYNVLSAGDPT